ncbi:L,D-transpeptidase family protein [Aromatoleum petrolei]|uniref:L,D-transpeptidase family protein n=1 Tax=Aromatoleum petrolei TaxID=76116 RepID=UPI001FD35BBE|nr:L,D-transpeptidase family protein [Aromatoleum petrolei]
MLALILLALATAAIAAPLADGLLRDALRERAEALRNGGDVRPGGGVIAARRVIPEFYESRGFAPAWADADRRSALLTTVRDSASHGLDPADYQIDVLRKLADEAGSDPLKMADCELLFTEALIRLVYHLRFGKVDPRELYPEWNFSRSLGAVRSVQALEALVRADSLHDAVERYAPQLESYRRLRNALSAYQAIEARGGWPALRPGPTLRAGEHDARVAALRARLAASGDYVSSGTPQPDLFDDGLRTAVIAFQSHHGLEPDGAVGRRTLAELQVDVGRRIEQIRVNLERLRWVAQDIEGDYLIVDIAGFSARLYLDNRLAWQSRVVVGRPYRKTPTFRAVMQYLVLNPKWVVPPTILREDVVPNVLRDARYLAENDMRVVDGAGRTIAPAAINWARYRNGGFPYQIVQAPGAENPLGRIKFMLPNEYSVYLHDTPSRALFGRSERAFSSGCIRLERPLELAVLLLDDPEQWNAEALQKAIEIGETRTVPVERRVPVMILYHTVEVGDDGTTDFRPDLYDRDAEVSAALARPFRFSTAGRAGNVR